MANFNKITPLTMAQAMACENPVDAVQTLCAAASPDEPYTPVYALEADTPTWRATGLAVRHGLLMEWLAAEAVAIR